MKTQANKAAVADRVRWLIPAFGKEMTMGAQPDEEHGDPLHVWYAGELLLTAMHHACMKFAVRRDASGLTLVSPNGWSGDLKEFIRFRGCRDYSGNEDKPVPADPVWDRLLEMADMSDKEVCTGTIRLEQRIRYPYTEWTVGVQREGPDCLQFELTLARVYTSLPVQDGATACRRTPNAPRR